MPAIKTLLGGGLALLVGAFFTIGTNVGQGLAWWGIVSVLLGLMQPYVSWSGRLKVALALAYFVAVAALVPGTEPARQVGAVLAALVLLATAVGIFRPKERPAVSGG